MAKTKAKTATQKSEGDILNSAFDRIAKMKAQETADADTVETEAPQPPVQTREPPRLASSNERISKSGAKAKSAMITYHPGNDDKVWTVWAGIKFDANMPKEVFNTEVIELAKKNPFFSVDGKRAPKHAKPIVDPDREEEIGYEGRVGSAAMPSGEDPEKAEIDGEDVI